MEFGFRAATYRLTRIADSSDHFTDFTPYVASLNDHGIVAFQATIRGSGTGLYAGSGGPIATIVEWTGGLATTVCSHPDIDRGGSVCAYAELRSGARQVILVRDGSVTILAEHAGPLGPTMNDHGTVAFRGDGPDGPGVFTSTAGRVADIAGTRDGLAAFHGLPVVNGHGAVAFRADTQTGSQGVYVGDGGRPTAVAETGEIFAGLGNVPIMNDAGAVAFCATLRGGGSGVFVASGGVIVTVIDTGGPFESFRGVLLDNQGRIIFFGTPRGGALGVFSGPDPSADRLLGLGDPFSGSTIVDFALNPVSINEVGQLAIRLKLANGLQQIVRADPVEVEAPPGPA